MCTLVRHKASEGKGGKRLCLEGTKARARFCTHILRSRPPFTGVLRGPGLKVPHGVLFGQFWAPASDCPKECFLSAFWPFLGIKTPKSTQKALFGALRGRCPKVLKKHSAPHCDSAGHFQARALKALLCKWRPGSQHIYPWELVAIVMNLKSYSEGHRKDTFAQRTPPY